MSNVNTYQEFQLLLLGDNKPKIFQTEEDAISYMQDIITPGTLKKIIYTESTIRTFNAGELTPKVEKKLFKDIEQIGVYKVKE